MSEIIKREKVNKLPNKFNKNMLTAAQVARELGIRTNTLDNWYKWYADPDYIKPKNTPRLPAYIQNTRHATRYWYKKDVAKIKKFQEWVPQGRNGVMADFHRDLRKGKNNG